MRHDYVPQGNILATQRLTLATMIIFCIFVYSGIGVLGTVYLAATSQMTDSLIFFGYVNVAAWVISGYLLRNK
jgi:hypothetical protein